MNIHLISLGCPKNLVDSEIILGKLQRQSVKIVNEPRMADTIIINTCGFIEDAKRESIETIFSAVQLKKQGLCKYILVTGCLSERYMSQLRAEIPEIDGFWGARGVEKFPEEMAQTIGINKIKSDNHSRLITTGPAYAYLKIAEGCDNLCTFCAIPAIRGPHVSRPEEDILHEAECLVEKGIKELILISQDTTYYGKDLKSNQTLTTLLQKLEKIQGLHWIRVLYTYPERISDELIETIANSEKICHYFDIPIQHISDRILRKMKRGTRKNKIEGLIDKLRNKIPDVAIRSSLIVGFPGETDQEFEELVNFVSDVQFDRLGVFKFSPEEGTEAARFEKQISEDVKQDRFELLMNIQQDISFALNQRMIGKEIEVHIDQNLNGNGKVLGRSRWDAPDIDQSVLLEEKIEPGTFIYATILEASEYDLIGGLNKKSNDSLSSKNTSFEFKKVSE